MSAHAARDGDGLRRRKAELRRAGLRKVERVARNAEKRAVLKLVSWNFNSFAPRASDVDALFTHEHIDILFLCETKQKRRESGSVKPLHFEGNVIAITAHAKRSAKRG